MRNWRSWLSIRSRIVWCTISTIYHHRVLVHACAVTSFLRTGATGSVWQREVYFSGIVFLLGSLRNCWAAASHCTPKLAEARAYRCRSNILICRTALKDPLKMASGNGRNVCTCRKTSRRGILRKERTHFLLYQVQPKEFFTAKLLSLNHLLQPKFNKRKKKRAYFLCDILKLCEAYKAILIFMSECRYTLTLRKTTVITLKKILN